MISPFRIKCIRKQGYFKYSDSEISGLAFGNRFAFILCSAILAIAVGTAHVPLLGFMMVVAFFGVILPYHPFDYIYNHLLRQPMKKPQLPPRSKQLKFACIIATAWLAVTIYLFYTGLLMAGYVLGTLLFGVAALVSTTDVCIPSMIYNFVFRVKG